jgi:hypothetical protein
MALEFGLATPADDAALRDLLRRTAMPGEIELAFLREPSFFVAARAGNRETQTMVWRDHGAGNLVGLGERSIRAAYVDGQPSDLGYLSNLRGAVDRRKGLGLARGYEYLRTLHGDGKARFYVTTILEDNAEAIALLTSGRARLPTYEHVGTLITYLLPIHRRRRARSPAAERVLTSGGLADAVACLDAWNRRHQFAPVYAHEDLAGATGLLPGFTPDNLYVVRERSRVRGTLGVWDQSGFKQTVVSSYSGRLARLRRLYNAYAAIRGVPGLPAAGSQLRLLHGAFLSAHDDEADAAQTLVQRALRDWSGRGASYLVLALAEGHPLSGILSRHAARLLRSRVYAVYWPDEGVPAFDRRRPLHVEVATL